ncbi:MAG: hypothetical protein A2583_09165 [Bdellovibrionales bacterium RIFOXYD1_FULL_53_11]|nr:MAG: hypothetical protein A2583_09165 [Bdellovibrionales bacterium RIFOXYD1_FULL_53_11]
MNQPVVHVMAIFFTCLSWNNNAGADNKCGKLYTGIVKDRQGAVHEPLNPEAGIDKSKSIEIFKKIAADSKHNDLKALWGNCVNFDEFAKTTIVEPRTIDRILSVFGAPPRDGLVVHAAAEHLYGYLFSTIKTPYGFKWERWLTHNIDLRFGLPGGVISPLPAEGSIFTNLTYFLGRIALRDFPDKIRILEKTGKHAARPLVGYPFKNLKISRITETIEIRQSNGTMRTVTFRKDIVFYPAASETDNYKALLVYSITDSRDGSAKLISAFPISDQYIANLLKQENFGKDLAIHSEYNAHVQNVTGATKTFTGTRTLSHGFDTPK